MTHNPFTKMALNAEFPILGVKYIPLPDPDGARRVTDAAQKLLIEVQSKMGVAIPPRHPTTSIGE